MKRQGKNDNVIDFGKFRKEKAESKEKTGISEDALFEKKTDAAEKPYTGENLEGTDALNIEESSDAQEIINRESKPDETEETGENSDFEDLRQSAETPELDFEEYLTEKAAHSFDDESHSDGGRSDGEGHGGDSEPYKSEEEYDGDIELGKFEEDYDGDIELGKFEEEYDEGGEAGKLEYDVYDDAEEDGSERKKDGAGKIGSFFGGLFIIVLLILVFAAAFYAKIRMDKMSSEGRNGEPVNNVSITGAPQGNLIGGAGTVGGDGQSSGDSDDEKNGNGAGTDIPQKEADYSWWESRDTEESADFSKIEDGKTEALIGKRVFFGNYPQGADGESENVSWIVLDADENKVFLASEYVLDVMPYSKSGVCQWENSDIRKWLNESFLSTAFTEGERTYIASVEIENEDNKTYGVNGGHDTDDRIFLLSMEDMEDYFSETNPKCAATPYTAEKKVATGGNEYATYWLRSPGSMDIIGNEPGYAANVDFAGEVKQYGNDVTFDVIGVRPAMWVSVEAFK